MTFEAGYAGYDPGLSESDLTVLQKDGIHLR